MSTNNQRKRLALRSPTWLRHRSLVVLCSMGAFAVLLLVLSVFGEQGVFRIRRQAQDRALLERKIGEVERDNESLRRQLAAMREGRASYELAAREKLGLVKPGEIVYDFREDPLRASR